MYLAITHQIRKHSLLLSLPLIATLLSSCGPSKYYTLGQSGFDAKNRGDFAVAEENFKAALDEIQFHHAADDAQLAPALFNLGSVYFADNKGDQAVALLERALAVSDKRSASDTVFKFDVCEELAEAYKYIKKFDKAEATSRRTLSISENLFGKSNVATATSLTHLGSILKEEGRYQEALDTYLRAERILDMADELHPESNSALCNNLALLYGKLHQVDKEEANLLKSLKFELDIRDFSPYVISIIENNLAQFYWRQGQLDKADVYFKKAIDVPLKTSVNNRSVVASMMLQYADLLKEMKRPEQAEAIIKRANAIGISEGGTHSVGAK